MRIAPLIAIASMVVSCRSGFSSRSPAYGLVLEQARDVVSRTWGPPQAWDSLCGTHSGNRRLILSLDPRLWSGGSDTDRVVASIPADGLERVISMQFVDRLCTPLEDGKFCDDSTADMTISLRPL